MKAINWVSDNGTFKQYKTADGHMIRREGDLTGLHMEAYSELLELRDFLNDLVCELEDF